MKFLYASPLAIAAALAASAAFAADATANEATASSSNVADTGDVATVGELIVTGTRQVGVKAADSAAPIQIVGDRALREVGQPDLVQGLAQNLPSFNAEAFAGDTANLTLSAALRGLNPNDTLVLVDGKRRHDTGNLAVDGGSPYQGAATTDLSFIPVGAIDRVEVLQDGAAAQYGSDAIAGVVNIILKDAAHGGSLSATGGQYYQGDGDTGAWSFNNGFELSDKGFVNFTAEEKYHDFSQRGGPDYRYYTPNGTLVSTLASVNETGIPGAPGAPDVNHIVGDAQYNIYNVFYNAGYDLGSGIQFYSFGSFGYRAAASYENYRPPSKVSGVTTTGVTVHPFPNGFDPQEALHEEDFSITGGLKGAVSGWRWDLSTTYGSDTDDIYTLHSANAQLFAALQSVSATPVVPQTNFYDGDFVNSEWTSNLDVDRSFNLGLAGPLNVAFGAEVRRDTFTIGQGDAASIFGAGAQSFPGFTATDAATHSRTNYSAYVDLATDPVRNLHLDLAGRYEHYTDFGDATVGKLTARYDFNSAFAIRGTISNGFRAPTLAEEYYSATNVSPSSAVVQLPANSAAAQAAGFAPLKPEISENYSVGLVFRPIDKLNITLDAYEIDIQDRIVGSGFLLGTVGTTVVSQGVLNAITQHGNTLDSGLSYTGISIFTNAANTRTRGVDLTAAYASDFDAYGHVDWTAGFNYNENTITKLAPLPAVVTNAAFGQTAILSPTALSALTTATPREKAVLGAFWTLDRWSVNLRETIYGPSSEVVSTSGTGVGGEEERIGVTGITDLDIGYKVTSALRINVGANNLFNIEPPSRPNIVTTSGGGLRPEDGSNVLNAPIGFSPFGIDGGYYYGRVTYSF
jgi:iron complex outermembrane receptor protein